MLGYQLHDSALNIADKSHVIIISVAFKLSAKFNLFSLLKKCTCTDLRVFQVVTKQWWIQTFIYTVRGEGAMAMNVEFCEDNSGSTQQVPFFPKNKGGGGGGGCPPASPLDPPLESVLVVPGMYKQTP